MTTMFAGSYGFVEFEDRRDAQDAVKDLDGKDMNGGRIRVEHARYGGGDHEESLNRWIQSGASGANRARQESSIKNWRVLCNLFK